MHTHARARAQLKLKPVGDGALRPQILRYTRQKVVTIEPLGGQGLASLPPCNLASRCLQLYHCGKQTRAGLH
jgi:hypothetical protein